MKERWSACQVCKRKVIKSNRIETCLDGRLPTYVCLAHAQVTACLIRSFCLLLFDYVSGIFDV